VLQGLVALRSLALQFRFEHANELYYGPVLFATRRTNTLMNGDVYRTESQ
jgi:hypothetical protein